MVIPVEITVDGVPYRVTKIEPRAFSPKTFVINFQSWGQSQITSITFWTNGPFGGVNEVKCWMNA